MLPKEICKSCNFGGEVIKNSLGFFYREGCKIFLCPQCKAPLSAPDNGVTKCTQCKTCAATESLIFN